jgi:methyl-accepting chemotaxis protein
MNDATSSAIALESPGQTTASQPSAKSDSASGGGDTVAGKPSIDVSKLPKIRRTKYVIDRRRQFRTAFLTSGLALLLLVIVNTAFTVLRTSQTMVIASAAPQLEATLTQQDTRVGAMLILVSVIFVIGVFAITIAETHRTAGAVFAMQQALERVVDGDYRTPLRLRPRDNLRDLRAPFNEMISSLRKSALADADELDTLARAVADGEIDTTALAERLADLAVAKRKLGETGSPA